MVPLSPLFLVPRSIQTPDETERVIENLFGDIGSEDTGRILDGHIIVFKNISR